MKSAWREVDAAQELLAGVSYIKTLANRFQKLDPVKVQIFGDKILEILMKKYTGHWSPEKPMRGRAYRCIRVNRNDREETILEACVHSGLSYQDLSLPKEMTLWIDPYEVSCRLGEDNYPYTVASFHPSSRSRSRNVEDPVPIPAPRAVFRTAAPLWIPGWRAPQFYQNSPEDHQQGFWVQEVWGADPLG
ncbi:hypothetical protein GDO81_027639 [Engystomops pustulosus]|uniref:Anti-proliferative protein domain-containing protein n=1 Tax=Engystomops pustulosus TaxID=76066 RepID=A0AAV6ZES9_ENGPU|nr:hypothetical protein GDO81_027639 [Engystomops pustulosus]